MTKEIEVSNLKEKKNLIWILRIIKIFIFIYSYLILISIKVNSFKSLLNNIKLNLKMQIN